MFHSKIYMYMYVEDWGLNSKISRDGSTEKGRGMPRIQVTPSLQLMGGVENNDTTLVVVI